MTSPPSFSINFLRNPLMDRARAAGFFAVVAYVLVCALIAGALVLWSIAVLGGIVFSAVRGAPEHAAGNNFKSVEAVYAGLQQEQQSLDAALTQLSGKPGMGRKLSGLTKTLPPRTWIKSLSWDGAGKAMKIDAVYAIDPLASNALPVRGWIAELKKDPQFSHGLKGVRSTDTSREREGAAELYRFTLEADW